MSAKMLLNLGLAAVAGALVLVVVLEPGLEAPPPPPTLAEGDPAEVSRMVLERPDAPTVVLTRQEGGWQLESPVRLPASDFKAEALARLLASPVAAEIPAPEDGLARFGLDDPAAVLTLDDTRIRFGTTQPVSGDRYVAVGERILLIPDRAWHHLTGPGYALASTALLGAGAEPERIVLPGLTLSRTEAGWQAVPAPDGMSADAPVELVEAWRNARALTVRAHQEPPADAREVTVHLAGREAPLEFLIHEAGGDTVFARPAAGVDYLVPAYTAERLLRLPDEVRGPDGNGDAEEDEGEDAAAPDSEGSRAP